MVNIGQLRSLETASKHWALDEKALERATGIEPAFSAWEADVLPLNYARVGVYRIVAVIGAASP